DGCRVDGEVGFGFGFFSTGVVVVGLLGFSGFVGFESFGFLSGFVGSEGSSVFGGFFGSSFIGGSITTGSSSTGLSSSPGTGFSGCSGCLGSSSSFPGGGFSSPSSGTSVSGGGVGSVSSSSGVVSSFLESGGVWPFPLFSPLFGDVCSVFAGGLFSFGCCPLATAGKMRTQRTSATTHFVILLTNYSSLFL